MNVVVLLGIERVGQRVVPGHLLAGRTNHRPADRRAHAVDQILSERLSVDRDCDAFIGFLGLHVGRIGRLRGDQQRSDSPER